MTHVNDFIRAAKPPPPARINSACLGDGVTAVNDFVRAVEVDPRGEGVNAEKEGRKVRRTWEVNPGEVWEENEFWIDLSWKIDPDNSRAASLLEDAEAGRTRIDYVGKNTNVNSKSNGNTNTNANANTSSNSNASSNARPVQPTPAPRTTPKPDVREKPTPKPNI